MPERRVSVRNGVASYDLTSHSNNSTGTLHDYITGKIAWFQHRPHEENTTTGMGTMAGGGGGGNGYDSRTKTNISLQLWLYPGGLYEVIT